MEEWSSEEIEAEVFRTWTIFALAPYCRRQFAHSRRYRISLNKGVQRFHFLLPCRFVTEAHSHQQLLRHLLLYLMHRKSFL